MTVVIAGGHGKIALRLERLLAADGVEVRGLVRNPAHAADLRAAGAIPVVADLEDPGVELAPALDGADAVVFAAGAGPGSGPARKLTMDRDGALRLVDACQAAGVRRYVIVSSYGAGRDLRGVDEGFAVYLRAKTEADEAVAASGLDFTIVRPGGLTDGPGTGRVRVGADTGRGTVPRDDVAAVLRAVLGAPNTVGATFELVAGDTPVDRAVAAL